MTVRKGTITGTGTAAYTGDAPTITGRSVSIRMDFGSASIDVEVQLAADGNWIKSPDATAITADYDKVYDAGVVSAIRLNCTSFTTAVAFTLATTD